MPVSESTIGGHSGRTRWGATADPSRRVAADVRVLLYQQGLLWRDLIRGERLPLDLTPLAAGDAWRKVGVDGKALETLRAPLIVGGLFAALLVAGGALLASGVKYPGVTTAISILGALGVTSAGLYARAKAQLTSLLESLRLAVDKQRVREAATICPPPPALESAPNRTGHRCGVVARPVRQPACWRASASSAATTGRWLSIRRRPARIGTAAAACPPSRSARPRSYSA